MIDGVGGEDLAPGTVSRAPPCHPQRGRAQGRRAVLPHGRGPPSHNSGQPPPAPQVALSSRPKRRPPKKSATVPPPKTSGRPEAGPEIPPSTRSRGGGMGDPPHQRQEELVTGANGGRPGPPPAQSAPRGTCHGCIFGRAGDEECGGASAPGPLFPRLQGGVRAGEKASLF